LAFWNRKTIEPTSTNRQHNGYAGRVAAVQHNERETKTMLKKMLLTALIALSFAAVTPSANAELDVPICYPCVR
jgi:hypothetical protein